MQYVRRSGGGGAGLFNTTTNTDSKLKIPSTTKSVKIGGRGEAKVDGPMCLFEIVNSKPQADTVPFSKFSTVLLKTLLMRSATHRAIVLVLITIIFTKL